MVFSELEIKRIEKKAAAFLEKRRPAAYLRSKLDVSFRIKDQSVIIFELRPAWREPDKMQEMEVAKATFVKTRKLWRVYWMRSDLKWHSYEPLAEAASLDAFFEEVDRDPYACFWG